MTTLDRRRCARRAAWPTGIVNSPGRLRRRRAPTRSGPPRSAGCTNERNATMLAHNYQLPAIQDVADHVGDSLALSRIAAEAPEDTIVFCGVHFMAETAKILSPDKTVLIPDAAGGLLAGRLDHRRGSAAWKDEHPGAVVVSYVNTTAAVKALTDICCTSSNAVDVVDVDRPGPRGAVLPDQFLGAHVQRVTGRKNLHVWAGECHVHAGDQRRRARPSRPARNPDAELFVHPECGCATSALYLAGEGASRRTGSRSCPPAACSTRPARTQARKVLVATEVGMLHQLRKAAPRGRLPRGQRPGVLQVHEDDHPGGAAALPDRGRRRGPRRPGDRPAGARAACSG